MVAIKKSVSDGKSSIASAITDNGVATAADATFATMKANINTACANKYNAGHSAGYSSGVTDADNRVNTGSTNYKTGYNNGYAAGAASGYKVNSGQFTQTASSAGWRKITFDTGLASVEKLLVHGYYASNSYYGAGGETDKFTANGGVVTVSMSFIAGTDHTIEWLACGH